MYWNMASCMYPYVFIHDTYMIHKLKFMLTTNVWFGVYSRTMPILTTEPLDSTASLPSPTSTPPLPSTGEPDSAAAPHSNAKTVSVFQVQIA